ncbi:MAG: septal ring lytic transglycosylase RlpA family protein [Sinobacteraceae bacterium]|nr:septal ring lytic transglycosylase RlpA family protein [Nevskiaceae bacterium]
MDAIHRNYCSAHAQGWSWAFAALFLAAALLATQAAARNTPETRAAERATHHPVDLSASARVGNASFYAKEFFGRKMADGAPMDPRGNNAASKTLPLGTTAEVTNMETGKSALVTIEDRGPFVPGRIVDLSPATARQIGLSSRQGVARVKVTPIAVPLPGGGVKLGPAAAENRVAARIKTPVLAMAFSPRTVLR